MNRLEVKSVIQLIEALAPPYLAASWDHSGVQVASFSGNIRSVAVMLDPDLSRVTRAIADGADFILAHHPLGMTPRYPDKADEYLAILSSLLEHKAWLYSAHTSLDVNPDGPVTWLADALQLCDRTTLEPICAGDAPNGLPYGFGFCGSFLQALPYEDFCLLLSSVLGLSEWQVCGPQPDKVQRIACCPGSGSSMSAAAATQADVFITGDVKYHSALDAPCRILDVGHFCLEEEMMRRVALWLQERVSVPVRFYPGVNPLATENW